MRSYRLLLLAVPLFGRRKEPPPLKVDVEAESVLAQAQGRLPRARRDT